VSEPTVSLHFLILSSDLSDLWSLNEGGYKFLHPDFDAFLIFRI